MFFDCFYQFLEVIEGEVFFFDEGGDGTKVGIVEILTDDALQGTLAELITTHGCVVLERGAVGMVRHVAFFFQTTYHGGEGVKMGLGVGIEFEHILHKHGTMFPKMVNGLLFFIG